MMKVQAVLVAKPRKRRLAFRGNARLPRRKAFGKLRVLLLCFMVLSLFGGVLLFSQNRSVMTSAFRSYYEAFDASLSATFAARLAASLLPGAGAGLLIWYFGLSPAGTAAVLPLLSARCLALGALSAWLVKNEQGGAAVYFCRLFPAKSLQLCGLFLLAYCACSCSRYFKSCLKQDSFRDKDWFLSYLKAGLPGMGLLVLSAFCEVLLTQWFGERINLSFY